MKTSHAFLLLLALSALIASSCKREPKVDFKRTDNTVIIRLEADPDRLNPVLSTSAYARVVFEQIFSYLVTQDPVTFEFVPQIAKSLPERRETPEGLIAFTYEIREEARWDDGSPVTANDFVFALKATLNPQVPAATRRTYLTFIKDLQTDPNNPRKFTVLSEKYILAEEAIGGVVPLMQEKHYDPQGLLRSIPLATFLNPEAIGELAKTDPRLAQFAERFSSETFSRDAAGVTGSGPYRLETWETGQRIVLTKKQNWWGEKAGKSASALAAYPDQITFKIIPDAVATLNALKAEEIDAASNLEANDFAELANTPLVAERYNLYSPASLINYFLYVNTTNPKLSDKRVRQALAYSINTQEIIDNVFNGYGQPVAGPVHPSAPYYNDDLKPIAQDIAKAKALLAEAGWNDTNNNGIVDKEINGQRVELSLQYLLAANREISRNVALLIQDNAKKAGIAIELVAKEPSALLDDFKSKNYEIGAGGRSYSNTLWDPRQSWHTQGDNRTGFGTPETDAIIDAIRVTLDEKTRTQQYKKLQQIIYDEQAEIYLLAPQDRIAVHKRFESQPSPIYPGYSIPHLRLKK